MLRQNPTKQRILLDEAPTEMWLSWRNKISWKRGDPRLCIVCVQRCMRSEAARSGAPGLRPGPEACKGRSGALRFFSFVVDILVNRDNWKRIEE